MSRYLHAPLRFSLAIVLVLASLVASVGPAGASTAPQDPAAQYASDSLLVKFKADTPAADKANARAAVQGQLAREYSIVPGLENLRLPVGAIGVEKAIDILSHLPSVEYAEPDYIVHSSLEPDDPSFINHSLWGMTNIKAPLAWDTFTGDPNFVVADIDTGIDYNHPDLAANVWTDKGWNFITDSPDPYDDNGHGTHTAGTIGAVGNNGIGVVGVNWNVEIMALKFLDSGGSGSTSDAIAALNWAVDRGVKVSNNSWGYASIFYPTALCDAVANAGTKGHIFVAAAGNSSSNNDSRPFYPAGCRADNVIAVAAINSTDGLASFSNFGLTSVDIGAPGENILSTTPGNTYGYYSGTSMATPHVAGAAALIWGKYPTWTMAEVRDRILSTARPLPALSGKVATGGTLDLAAAISGSAPEPVALHLAALSATGSAVARNKWTATVTITVKDANGALVDGAEVSGSWSGGVTGTASCTTGTNGTCQVKKTNISTKVTSVTFTVTNIAKTGATYVFSGNEVNPPSITVAQNPTASRP